MESVFVEENSIDINQWTNDNSQFQKLKIGEIFQLSDTSLSMTCINCSQEFQYFTEFSLHIQEHYLRGEVAQLKEIKEEISSETQSESQIKESTTTDDELSISPTVKCEVNVEDGVLNDADFDTGWSDGEFNDDFEDAEAKIEPTSSPKIQTIVEGTDYAKLQNKFQCLICNHETAKWKHLKEHLLIHSSPKDVMCPICSKLFATIAYVQKHLNRTHNMKITTGKIKEAQQINTPNIVSSVHVSHVKPQTEKRTYNDGTDYKRIGEEFQCLTCDRKMIKFDHMKEHLLIHSSEKNVFCPICARAFITESYVRKHVNRTHKRKITAEEIKLAQSSIDIVQKKKEWAIERDVKIAQNNKIPKPKTLAPMEEGMIRCIFCVKWFTKARYAQKHMRLIHAKSMTIGQVINSQPMNDINTDFDDSLAAHVQANSSEQIVIEPFITFGEHESEPEKKFECFECHKRFVSANSVRIHMKLHSGIKYRCPYCDKIFAMKSYVRDHIVIMHGIKRDNIPRESILQASGNFTYTQRPHIDTLECYLCKNQYKKRNRLREHMHSHVSGPYLCVICGAVYKTTDTLRHHMERHKANPNEKHRCSECDKMYPTRRYMLSHYRSIHLNKRRKRVSTDRKSEVSCEICDKKFLSQHNLNQHMMVHNRDPNELICHICGWEFKERSNLKQHMESHGNNKTTCEICNKVLSNRYLQEHMKIHSGHKEFQCSTCGKQFVSRERLKRHMVRHSGEPKYKCDLCPKAYTRSDKLLYHRRTHDQQMTHTCQSCGKGFFSIKSLRKHENKHYLEDNGIAKPN